MNTNNKSNDQCQQYGCYPFVMTKFAIDETERGCGDLQFSGQNSTLSPCGCGGCCVFCVPIAAILDIGFFIPCGLGWGVNKIKDKCKEKKPKVTIVIQPH